MDRILKGGGIFSVGGVPVGLCRGGGQFLVEREIREIEADGDFGPVVGRQAIDREVAKITMNMLEFFSAEDMEKYFPGTLVTAGATVDTWTSTLKILLTDYNNVSWTGKTKEDGEVVIELDNCLNLGNLDFALEDKTEVVPVVELTAHYAADARETPPWRIKKAKGDVYTVTFTVGDGSADVEGAQVFFNYTSKLTDSDGEAVFTNVAEGDNKQFTVVKGGFVTYFGAVDVDDDEAVAVTLVAVA
jgi:hypothetical protein